MKAAILLVCCIVIFHTQADVKENDHSELCEQCKESTLPKCEGTVGVGLHSKIECKEAGCIIVRNTDGDTSKICVLAAESLDVATTESKSDSLQSNIQPVPIALQMITTTESSKDSSQEIDDQTDAIAVKGGSEVDEMVGDEQPEQGKESVKIASEETVVEKPNKESVDAEGKSAEKSDEPKPVEIEEENNAETLAASVEQVSPLPDPAHPSNSPIPAPEPPSRPSSIDYLADEPSADVVDVEQPIVPPEEPPHPPLKEPVIEGNPAKPIEQQNTSENSDEGKETLHADKDEIPTNNASQAVINEVGNTEVDHSDNMAQMSQGQAEMHVDNAGMQSVNDAGANNVGIIVPTASPMAPVATTAAEILTCYSCTSATDKRCASEPGIAVNCQTMGNKANGCYTLYKADTNTTTRGCFSELTDDGLKYCMSNSKQCILCYEKVCNNLLAPSNAVKVNAILSLWLGIVGFIFFAFLI